MVLIERKKGLSPLSRVHLAILAVGALFLISTVIHENIWFDEAYTVALLSHDLGSMVHIAMDDVHPLLYYIVAWFVYFPTKSIVLLRLLSVVFAVLLAALGYTHIRRDFGERVGLWFTALTFLLPSTVKYAGQMRMYTLAALLVMLAAIYAYRFGHALLTDGRPDGRPAQGLLRRCVKGWNKNLLLFVLSSVAAASTHHFALAAVCFVNLYLLIFILIKNRAAIATFVTAAVAQVALYLPTALIVLHQIGLNGAAGIRMEWRHVLTDTLAFHLLGDQKENAFGFSEAQYIFIQAVAWGFFALMVGVAVRAFLQKRPHSVPVLLSAGVYFGVLLAAWIVSAAIRPIFLERYTMVMYGLWIFGLSFACAHIRFKTVKAAIITLLSCILVLRTVPLYTANYGPELDDLRDYLDEQVEADDTFGYQNIVAFRLSVYYPEHTHYFYNFDGREHWDIEDAYRAFENVTIFRRADEIGTTPASFGERIWLVNRNTHLYWELTTNYGYTEVQSETFYLPYYNCTYEMILLTR